MKSREKPKKEYIMYTDKNEFTRVVNPEMLNVMLSLRSTSGGVFTYNAMTFDGIRIKVDTSMHNMDDVNYFHQETLESLMDSDTIQVYFNGVLVLSFSTGV